ncbi:MAG: 4Fe-4S binding protein [Oscillospiraceae bacterium]|jgi:NAD-dependent dihydropyrimidine dehydrogenase PreA subunit|nr:4Fe-4S binding protein [Oscillospiraceae bacterium]
MYSLPSLAAPCKVLEFDKDKCVGCNACVNTCPCDVMIPNPEPGEEPIVLYAEECWFCGGCVEECPHKALTLVPPAKQRLSTIWVRKSTGKEYRMGMKDPLPPNTRKPSGRT